MCRILEVQEGSYYAWRKRMPSARVRANQKIVEQLLEIARQSKGVYGSRRSVHALASAGIFVNRKRVVKLMRCNGLTPIRRTAKPAIMTGITDAENILDRRFRVTEPDKFWASDITNVATKQGWLSRSDDGPIFSTDHRMVDG
jgi:putative transposase